MPRRANALQLLLFPFLAVHGLFPLVWLTILAQDGPRENDWRHFQIVAEQFVSGNWTHLYIEGPDPPHPGYFWRYPPYALYLVAPLAWMTRAWAYGVLATLGVAALVASIVMLARLAPPRGMAAEWTLAVALSAPALGTLMTGQISAFLLLCVVIAAVLWSRKQLTGACAVLGLLAFKPNIGIFFGYYLLVRREWRGLAAMLGVVAALCLLTLPLGFDVWADFVQVSVSNVDTTLHYDAYKLITLKGFLGTVLGQGPATVAAWGVTAIVLLIVAAWAWTTPAPAVRHLGLVVLLAIAANPYGFFYDALLLAVPAAAWWSERDGWRRGPWLTVGVLIAVVWCWEQSASTWSELLKLADITWVPPFSLVGPAATIWLVLAARESRRTSA
jgi:hypothetical protein